MPPVIKNTNSDKNTTRDKSVNKDKNEDKGMRKKVGVIGAGAAGMMAAITAARNGAQVTILERNDRMGKKLLMTGNGKCNLGNRQLTAGAYAGAEPAWITRQLEAFDTQDTITFFRGLGLLLKDRNGYLYPACEQASVVLDVLRLEIKSLGIEVLTGYKVHKLWRNEADGRTGVCAEGREKLFFDRVILACGSKAAPKTGSDGSGYKLAKQLGHHLIPVVPALVQLRCQEDYLKAVAGVRAEARILLADRMLSEQGELQLTDYGISGIPVFQLSRHVNYLLREQAEVTVSIDLLPDMTIEETEQLFAGRNLLQGNRTVEEYFTGMLNKKLMMLFIRLAGLKPGMPVEEAARERLWNVYQLCKDWRLHVTASNPYENAQVCAGGVDAAEVTQQLESRLHSGVFFAGELLDVDGKCGGYNLQWAWCSGYLAGRAAAL